MNGYVTNMPEYELLQSAKIFWDVSDGHFNPKSTGLFPPGAALGGVLSTPLCKIRSRLSRKLKFTGLIAYVMFYKICKFESSTIINDVITKNNGKMWYLTLTSIKFDPDSQKI